MAAKPKRIRTLTAEQRDRKRKADLGRWKSRLSDPEYRAKRMVQATKTRAKRAGIDFNIDQSDLLPFPDVCLLLGIPMTYTVHEGNNDGSPSIDRIDPAKGYVKGNVWVVSRRSNAIKNDATIEELRLIADNLARLAVKGAGLPQGE